MLVESPGGTAEFMDDGRCKFGNTCRKQLKALVDSITLRLFDFYNIDHKINVW